MIEPSDTTTERATCDFCHHPIVRDGVERQCLCCDLGAPRSNEHHLPPAESARERALDGQVIVIPAAEARWYALALMVATNNLGPQWENTTAVLNQLRERLHDAFPCHHERIDTMSEKPLHPHAARMLRLSAMHENVAELREAASMAREQMLQAAKIVGADDEWQEALAALDGALLASAPMPPRRE